MQRLMAFLGLVMALLLAAAPAATAQQPPRAIQVDEGGRLAYHADADGNRVPDFSYCGYASGETEIPFVSPRVVVPPAVGDDTARIQAAIDHVSTLPLDANGFRGAVVLMRGTYEISGSLTIAASGVVLRGQGMGEDGTILRAIGLDRRTLIRIRGRDDRQMRGEAISVTQPYVPVNSMRLEVAGTAGLAVGDRVFIRRPATERWIQALGTDDFGGDRHGPRWHTESHEIAWDRTITAIDGRTIAIDAPLTTAIAAEFGGPTVQKYNWPGRIERVGVENLRLISEYDADNPKDEDHSWFAITCQDVENAWVRRVTAVHFAGGAVALWERTSRVTVEDCRSLAPISEVGGFRRTAFQTLGQLNLFQRCVSQQGRHDFAAGFMAAGPNAFVQCEAIESLHLSGGISSWASGVLYDNVRIDGNVLGFGNLSSNYNGAGWSAANSVLWQCSASVIRCYSPPTAQNWAFGCWGQFEGDGHFESSNEHIQPQSLYYAQLAERVGHHVLERAQLKPIGEGSESNPSIQQAAALTRASGQPAVTMDGWIEQVVAKSPIGDALDGVPSIDEVNTPSAEPSAPQPQRLLAVTNGWLTLDGKLAVGSRTGVPWWAGGLTPRDVSRARPAVTRFVPGREGLGFTDDLDEMTDQLAADGVVALEHNYGLWYDRRRDDHQRIRRMDGDVWAPFYEQPFARSGIGRAWDGLSKYDLTKYNPWYWSRLSQFVALGEQKGIVLLHNHYFQHNILEAGAHWVDSPWRSANAIQDTGFLEPPPFAADKRIFMAEQFYDVSHPVRRELHRAYIRQCLDNFAGQNNVIHVISAEYTGPLHFMEFWLDTIAEWQAETGHDAIIALSATRDVQDAILADPARAELIDVIDIRYWWYQPDGSVYAPEGGRNLAPRQHARLLRPRPATFEQVARAVREYRLRYHAKAVIYSAEGPEHGWAVLMAGGSLANVPRSLDAELLAAVPQMMPAETGDGILRLQAPDQAYLAYVPAKATAAFETGSNGRFVVRWIDPGTGKMRDEPSTIAGGRIELSNPADQPSILWMSAEEARE